MSDILSIDNSNEKSYTVGDYISGCVNFEIPDETIRAKCFKRGINPDDSASETDSSTLDLLEADILVWIVYGASSVNNTSDSDNGWTHSGGGYQLTSEDKDRLLARANSIYSENGEATVGRKSTFRIVSNGIREADRFINGVPVPRIIK